EVAKAALGSERAEFEFVFVQIGLRCDLEGAAVVFGAADNNQRRVYFLASACDAKMGEFVTEDFARALPPVGEDADAGFEVGVDRVDDHAVGASACDAEKVACFFWLLEGSGEAQGDIFELAVNQFFRGARNVPRKIELLGEDVGGSAGKKREWDAMSIL